MMCRILFSTSVLFLLALVACASADNSPTGSVSVTSQPPSAAPSTPTIIPSPKSLLISSPAPSLTPSAVPTHSLEFIKNKLSSATPAFGFTVLEMPTKIPPAGTMTVTIFTAPGTLCSIQYKIPDRKSVV